MSTLVGFKTFKSKAGKEFCVANVVTPYSARELQGTNFGSKVEEIFLPEEQFNYLHVNDLGKEVKIDYDIVGGRAYVAHFEVVGKK